MPGDPLRRKIKQLLKKIKKINKNPSGFSLYVSGQEPPLSSREAHISG